jgi:rRNA maturation endonuclease Nob1
VVVSGLLIVAAAVSAVLLQGVLWRLGAFFGGILLSIAVRTLSQFFFRCPACGYICETGPWHTEPKWHACPSCGIQFTAERKLRWPAL